MTTLATSTTTSQDALLAVCLFAAFADGEKSDAEREEVRRLADEFGSENLPSISRQILLRKLPLESVVANLAEREDRLLAYEMALGVCEVNGSITPDEQDFLDTLRRLLNLGEAESRTAEASVDALALSPVSSPGLPAATSDPAESDGMILKYAFSMVHSKSSQKPSPPSPSSPCR